MEIQILEETKRRIKIELPGEDHTFCNILKNELWNDSSVHIAGYNIDHPLVGSPVIIVETTTGKSAKDALFAAVKRIKKTNSTFLKACNKEVK